MVNKQKVKLDKIIQGIEKTAKELNIEPSDVNKTQFFSCINDITDWDMRTFGGLSTIKNSYFPVQNKDLAIIRKEKEISSYIKKLESKASSNLVLQDELMKIITESLKDLPIEKVKVEKPSVVEGTGLTVELMLSDIHYGLKTSKYNYKIAREKMQKLCKVFKDELMRKEKEGYKIDKIIVALLGDIINSFSMHGLESAIGSEFGNAAQVQAAITSLYYDILLPIGQLGYPIYVPCVTGNHDRSETYRTMNDPGLNNLTWIIYNTLAEYCKLANLTNVTFEIAKGPYIIYKIYNNNCLYEHGDNSKGNSKKSLETLMSNRATQNNITVDFIRLGHWHDYVCFDRGRIIVNESVGGKDSYADVLGFDSKSGQTINFYVNTKKRANSFFYSFPVDLT